MIDKNPIKVVIDTNLWISFLIGKQLSSLKLLLTEGVIQPVLSQQLLDEILLVTQRPKLRKYFAVEKVLELLAFLEVVGLLVTIRSDVSICRDAKNNYLLALSKDGKADYLITGDEDLLILKDFDGTEIITYRDLMDRLNSEPVSGE